jgi:hypothetical protein
VQGLESLDGFFHRRGCRQVDEKRLHLGAQKVVGAARTQGGEARVLGAGQEVEHGGVVAEVADLWSVGRNQSADGRGQGGRLGPAFRLGKGSVPVECRTERLGAGVGGDVFGGGVDDPERVLLALLAGVAPRGDAVPAEDAADGIRVGTRDGGDVQAELEAGATPRNPGDFVAENGRRELFPVCGGRYGDARVGVKVIDVRGVDEAVHRGVDRRCGAALAVECVVERRDHFVLAIDAGVHVAEGAHAVEPQYGEARLGEGAEVSA